jgi:hypothetical protein
MATTPTTTEPDYAERLKKEGQAIAAIMRIVEKHKGRIAADGRAYLLAKVAETLKAGGE